MGYSCIELNELNACWWAHVLSRRLLEPVVVLVNGMLYSCRHRKRGLAILPTKFGISFTFKPMNQAGALVSIFLDGSVAIAHGGIEMGQGVGIYCCYSIICEQYTWHGHSLSFSCVHGGHYFCMVT